MIRRLLGWGIVIVAALIGYNLYFGTPEEKANAKEIVEKVKNIGKDSWDLLKSEKEKMAEGKYDNATSKIKDLFDKLKGVAQKNGDNENLSRLMELEEKRQQLEAKYEEEVHKPAEYGSTAVAQDSEETKIDENLKRDLLKLYEDTERLMSDMEKQ